MTLEWEQVRPFFDEHGCVVIGSPESRWYEESWGALGEAGHVVDSAATNSRNIETALKLRAVCLLAMYLGMYQAAGEFSELGAYCSGPSDVSWYLYSLDVEIEDIWMLARGTGFLNTDHSSYWEDEDVDDEMLLEIAMDMTRQENENIYRTLMKHYGETLGLFESLWNSRFQPDEIDPLSEIVNFPRPGDGKLEIWSYVEEGMAGWWWT